MKSPRGFGKNYFTFSAILAYSVQNKLQSQLDFASSFFIKRASKESKETLDAIPILELTETLLLQNAKPCYCNILFKLKTRLSLLLNIFISRCPFYCKYFAFRRSGVHPPHF
ncbi:MAG TPA: hypothetical protein CFH84_00035 [Sulfurimonas sp. UBA12504]|nr:MAG: hypothetical protein A2019_07035 [Sulfurimonas sp. GWF2_37_8]DAB31208.1 MAG TPA: hypothetical protein CFH84_00035 [Sulfurimonas sp. UBA12504]